MHLAYGEARGNAAEARRVYVMNHPDREAPDRKFFQNIGRHFREGTLRQVRARASFKRNCMLAAYALSECYLF